MSISRIVSHSGLQAHSQAVLRAALADKEGELAAAQQTIAGLWDATIRIRTEQVHADNFQTTAAPLSCVA